MSQDPDSDMESLSKTIEQFFSETVEVADAVAKSEDPDDRRRGSGERWSAG